MTAKGSASSRLLNMKFMQRAAAAESPTSIPSTPNGQPAKRIRLSDSFSSPATPAAPTPETEDELRRKLVMDRLAEEAGETRWVLNVQETRNPISQFQIVQTGFADLDSASEDEDADYGATPKEKLVEGRKIYGKVAKSILPKQEKRNGSLGATSGASSSGASDEDEDAGDDIDQLIREERPKSTTRPHKSPKEQAAKEKEQQRLAALRRQREINLNTPIRRDRDGEVKLSHITSISGGGSSSGSARPSASSYRPKSRKRP